MKQLTLIFLTLLVFISCRAQNELPKHSIKTVATKYLRGLSSGELGGDGIMRIPYNFGPSGNYRVYIGGNTGDTALHTWIDQRIDEWFTAGGGFWLTGSNFAITDGVIASYETFTFSGDGSSFVYDDNTLTATGTGTSGTTTLTIGGATSPSFLVQANNEIRLQSTSTGNVTVYNSGSRTDSTIVNEKRLQDIADTKEDVITGAATTIVSSDLTADRAVISTAIGKIGISSITATELATLAGINSNVQDQIDAITSVSGDYWPKAGNFEVGQQIIDYDTELRFRALPAQPGVAGLTIGDDFVQFSGTPDGGVSSTFAVGGTAGVSFNSADTFSLVSTGTKGMKIVNTNASGNVQIHNSGIRTDSTAVNEYRLQQVVSEGVAGGGVDEDYVAQSIDSVRSELNTNAILKASATYQTINGADWILQKSTTADENLIIRKTGGGNGDLILSSTSDSELRATRNVIITTTGGNGTITANGVNNPNSRTDSTIVNEFRLQQFLSGFVLDTIHIGGWNMDADQTHNVTLPVVNSKVIAVLDAGIYHDGGTTIARKWRSSSAGVGAPDIGPNDLQTLSSTTFQLVRANSGYFDSAFFDDDTINRGYLVILYTP